MSLGELYVYSVHIYIYIIKYIVYDMYITFSIIGKYDPNTWTLNTDGSLSVMYTGGDDCDDSRTYRETAVTFKCLENIDGMRYEYDEEPLCKRMLYYYVSNYII